MNTGIIAIIKNLAPFFLYLTWLGLCVTVLTGRVKYGLFLLLPLFPLQNVVAKIQGFPFGKDFNDILIISMFLGWFIRAAITKEKIFERSAFNILLLAMFFFTYFSLWQATFYLGVSFPVHFGDPRVQNWKNYVVFFLLFWLVFNNIKSMKDMKWLFISLACAMFLVNYYTLDQIRWSAGLASRTKFHGTFVWLGPNEVAGFYVMYLFVIAGIFWFIKNKLAKVFLLFLILQNIYAILFLFSRGAYVALLVGLVVFGLLNRKWILVIVFLALMSWQTILPRQVIDRIEQTETEYGELDDSSGARIIMWEQSLQLFMKSPIIGVGFNVFPYIGFELGDTHNVFIKFLAEQGIVGLGLLLILLALSFRSGLRLYRLSKDPLLKGLGLGFACCVISCFVVNMFGDRWTHTPVGAWFWVFLAMVERGNLITARENENERLKLKEEVLRENRVGANTETEAQKPRVKMWNVKRGEA